MKVQKTMRSIFSVLMTMVLFAGMMSAFCLSVSAGPVHFCLFPVENGEVIREYYDSSYGAREPEHAGIDIAGVESDYVYAAYAGVVIQTADLCSHDSWAADHDTDCGHYSTHGNYIYIDGGVVGQYYGHIQQGSLLVQEGDYVQKGQPIARIGASGCAQRDSLHFEVRWMIHEDDSNGDWVYVGHEWVNSNVGQTTQPGAVIYDYTGYQSVGVPLTVQPLPEVVEAQKNKEASVTIVETGDSVTFDWYYKNAGDEKFVYTPNFKGSTYSIVMTDARNGRQVYCVVTDRHGNQKKTNVVTFKIEERTPLTVQPLPKTVVVKNGKTAKVTVKETGDNVTLKWYYKDKGSNKFVYTPNFKGATYSVVMTDARAGRQVYCVVSDMYGNSVKTNIVTFDQAVKIQSVTKSNVKAVGKTAKVTVNASGTGLKYTWYYKNKGASAFVKTSSFKSKTYSLAMKDSNAGRQVYCVVTDKYGNSVKSEVVTLDIPVRIKTQPKSVKVAIGKTASVSVKANGSGLKYKWYYKDKGDSKYKLASRKSRTYSVVMSKARAGRQVYCVITDKYGNRVKTKVVTLNKK